MLRDVYCPLIDGLASKSAIAEYSYLGQREINLIIRLNWPTVDGIKRKSWSLNIQSKYTVKVVGG